MEWNPDMEGAPKLAKIITENDIEITFAMWKHSELALAHLMWMIARNRKR